MISTDRYYFLYFPCAKIEDVMAEVFSVVLEYNDVKDIQGPHYKG